MDNQSLKRLQACELEIFKGFLHACEKLDLTYYLLGGTLLGAVRHQGFIPWDDDIDVGMPRKDYDRFITEAQAFLPEYYFIQTGHTDPEYPMNFAKIRDSRTTFVENGLRYKRINHGVYIDVFPLDYYPENSLIQKAFDFKNRICSGRIRQEYILPQVQGSLIHSFLTQVKKLQYAFVILILRRQGLHRKSYLNPFPLAGKPLTIAELGARKRLCARSGMRRVHP